MMVSEDDILQVNEKILKFFNNEKENIPVYQKIVSILIWNCLNSNIPYGITSEKDKIQALSSYYEAHPFPDKKAPKEEYTYREYKNMFEFITDLHEYITHFDFTETMFRLNSDTIIDVYEDYLKKPKKSSFIGKNEENINLSLKR